MKTRNKVLAMLLSVAMLISITGFTAYAAESTEPAMGSAAVGTKVFDGYNVTILDKTTPAVDMRGRPDDHSVMCFVSADDREIGVMAYSDYLVIINRNQTLIQYADGGSLAAPPDGYEKWHDWFADEFNNLRGLDVGSREKAVGAQHAITAAETAITIEEYRQEVIQLVNQERENVGLPAYIINDKCMEYSQIRAQELLTLYSHTRPDGNNAGYEIIYNGPQTPSAAVRGWMDSPGHKAAILNENRVYVGAGCNIAPNGAISWQMYFERDPEVYANTLILG